MFIDPNSPFRVINFEMGNEPHVYNGTLVLPRNRRFLSAEIESMKQQQYEEWLNIVNPPSEPEPVAELPTLIGHPEIFIEVDGVRYYRAI